MFEEGGAELNVTPTHAHVVARGGQGVVKSTHVHGVSILPCFGEDLILILKQVLISYIYWIYLCRSTVISAPSKAVSG